MRILKRAAIAVANRFPLLSDESKMKIYCACITDPESAASRHRELLSRKPDQRMYADMRKALHKYGMFYDEYAVYGCDVNPPGDYITEAGRMTLLSHFNDKSAFSLFADKYSVYSLFRDYYKRRLVRVSRSSDYEAFASFYNDCAPVFAKPLRGSCGNGAVILESGDNTKALFETLSHGEGYVCEELIRQNGTVRDFNPDSVNTVRFTTVLKDEKVIPFYPFFRMGRKGGITDNAGASGVMVPVDSETGRLGKVGRDENGRYFNRHPDSKIPFDGFLLPEWDNALNLMASLARTVPAARCVSFDIAYSANGWILVEANLRGQFIGQQLCCGKGLYTELVSLL